MPENETVISYLQLKSVRMMRASLLRILPVIVIIAAAQISAYPSQPVIIDGGEHAQNITGCLDFIEDRMGTLTISEISVDSVQWQTNSTPSINRGFTSSAFWFRLQLSNNLEKTVNTFIEIDKPVLDYIDFFIPQKNGTFESRKTGDMRHFSTRDVTDLNFVFSINAQPGRTILYFRIRTDSTFRFQVLLFSPLQYIKNKTQRLALIWIFFGMLLLLIIYNFTIMLFTRSRSYLYFVIFGFSVMLFQMVLRGLAFQYIWPEAVFWNSMSGIFFQGAMCATATLFFHDQLDTKNSFPLLHKALLITGLTSAASGMILAFTVKSSLANTISYPLVTLLSIIILISILIDVYRKNRYAVFLLTGFFFFLIMVPVNIALAFGLLPMMTITEFSFDFSILWLVVFSSLGLAFRINLMTKELKAGRELLQLAIDGSNDGIWDYTPGSDSIYLSPRCFTMLGYDPGDLPHTIDSVIRLIHPDDRSIYISTFDLKKECSDEQLNAEFRMLSKNGEWRWIAARGKMVLEGRTGGVCRISGTNSDITERRISAEALRVSEEKYRLIVNTSPLDITISDLEGRILMVSPVGVKLFGLEREEQLLGRQISEFIVPEDRDRAAYNISLMFQGIMTGPAEYRGLRPDGTSFDMEANADFILDASGRPDKIIIIILDITDRRGFEREMMNTVSDERRKIGQDLHDDLGQTLTGVTFLVQTLSQEIKGLSDAAETVAGKIANLVMNAIMKVRTISKMLIPVELDENGFITAIEEMVANIQDVFLISCEVLYDTAIEINDNGKAVNLYYIAREAVNNALKHGKADEIVIRFTLNGQYLVMTITDNGTGFDIESPSEGIGLKTIDYRARLLGASVRISKAEPCGTSVMITMPL